MKTKTFGAPTSLNEQARTVDVIASTSAVDAHGEVVAQDWRLERFLSNPIILAHHDSRALPVGRATRVEVIGERLELTVEFAPAEANPEAEKIWQLVRGGFLKTVSVGFVPGGERYEMRDGKEVVVLLSPELMEVSFVAIPANPEAKVKSADPLPNFIARDLGDLLVGADAPPFVATDLGDLL
jgi:HK97 family phage prohead protease